MPEYMKCMKKINLYRLMKSLFFGLKNKVYIFLFLILYEIKLNFQEL